MKLYYFYTFILQKHCGMARVKLRCIMGCSGLKSSYQEKGLLYYYPFVIKLDRCVESCNTLNDLPNKV